MKTESEKLSPTRVKLTVEVPFDELKPAVETATKKIADQVQIPGFRKGKVPSKLVEQRFGRPAIMQEAVNDALPRFYGDVLDVWRPWADDLRGEGVDASHFLVEDQPEQVVAALTALVDTLPNSAPPVRTEEHA